MQNTEQCYWCGERATNQFNSMTGNNKPISVCNDIKCALRTLAAKAGYTIDRIQIECELIKDLLDLCETFSHYVEGEFGPNAITKDEQKIIDMAREYLHAHS